ncbi:putative phage abortive infection protein [Saccharicrinis sp. FJH54]|uniref:putative phage abortive infection protein n=1 Tax=Saccharicrinis sp. FJH54 TaxID=3344665 RepID=UPI0035D3EE74
MKNKINIWLIILPTILFVLLVSTALIIIWTWENPLNINAQIEYDAFGTYGAFFGGVIGTLFAIAGVIFVYFTYKNQVDFHEKEQIESRFFELIKLHDKNVEELKNIDKDIFNFYIKNIKNFVKIVDEYNISESKNWDGKTKVKLGYLYFFYGSSEYTAERLTGISVEVDEITQLNLYIKALGIEFNGAFGNFGKYFRQLFQIVTYIDNKSILKYKEKEQYIKSIRVRLNIEEQYLLFLNSLVSMGLDWEKGKDKQNKQLITKYNLLKNIPKEYIQIDGADFKTEYPNIHYEFMGDKKSEERKRLESLYF